MADHAQGLPVRVYQTATRLMVAAPLPGLEPGDITITITGDRVTIRGEQRGPHQHEADLLVAEWTVGPYGRELSLVHPVNGPLTNATYGNGVLVLSMPKVAAGAPGVPAELRLEPVNPTRGEHVGHVGRRIQPSSTSAHRHEKHEPASGLASDDLALLGEVLSVYLADFRREVAGTENPDFRASLQHRQNALERMLERFPRRQAA